MATLEDVDFSSKPSSDNDSDRETEAADPLIELFDDNFDKGTVYVFPALYTSKLRKHLKPVLPQEDQDPAESDKSKKKSKKKKKVVPEAHLIDEDLLHTEKARLRADDSEWDVLQMVRAVLEEVTGPDDPPVFLLHSQEMDSSGENDKGVTSSRGEKDVLVFHRRLGVILLEVKATENVQAMSRMNEAVSQLLHAQRSLQREMGWLGAGAVSLAVALPNLSSDKVKVIRAQAKVTGDPTKTTQANPAPTEPPSPSQSDTKASMESTGTSPQHPDVASTPHLSMTSSDASSCPLSTAPSEASCQKCTGTSRVTTKIKATSRLGDHPEVELLCGRDLHVYQKWLQDIMARRTGSDPYVMAPTDDGDVILKKAVCRRCSVPCYGDAIRSVAQQHERWLLTPQQMQLRDMPDLNRTVVHLVGPPGVGKTLLLVHRARRWLGAGMRVAMVVGYGNVDTLLTQLGMRILRGQRASDARDRLILCTNNVQLWDAAMAGDVCVVVDELEFSGYDVLFRTGLHLMHEGRVTAMWTADMMELEKNMILEAETLGVTVRSETLSTCLRCSGEVVQLLNVVRPDGLPPVQLQLLPRPRSFITRTEFLFHTDHDPSSPFHSCHSCRDSATAILKSLALPGFCLQDPDPLEFSDCVIILTGIFNTDTGMPQSVVRMVSWLQELGLPVVCEWEKLMFFRYSAVTLPYASSSSISGEKITESAAWRERVLKGRDQSGQGAIHVVRAGHFLGLEKKAVIVVHLDDDDDDPKHQGQSERKGRQNWHQTRWYFAASRCQAKLAFLVLSPSPALHFLHQAAELARSGFPAALLPAFRCTHCHCESWDGAGDHSDGGDGGCGGSDRGDGDGSGNGDNGGSGDGGEDGGNGYDIGGGGSGDGSSDGGTPSASGIRDSADGSSRGFIEDGRGGRYGDDIQNLLSQTLFITVI